MKLNRKSTQRYLDRFDFESLFIEELGWDIVDPVTIPLELNEDFFEAEAIAQKRGFTVYQCMGSEIPERKVRLKLDRQLTEYSKSHLLIFGDEAEKQQVWMWVKQETGQKSKPRFHTYNVGKTAEALIQKLEALVVDIEEEDNLTLVEVSQRVKQGFNIEQVTKQFFQDFEGLHQKFCLEIAGIDQESDRRWYASVLLNRLMFVYFLQRRYFLDDGDNLYLQNKLKACQAENQSFYEFLKDLFFQGFAKPEFDRDQAIQARLGKICYLNGGLFLKHSIEQKYPAITVSDRAFEEVFQLFSAYSWHLNDRPDAEKDSNEINPDVLGYIFEKYINQKEFGAYYTRPEITEYLCDRTINKLVVDRSNELGHKFADIDALLDRLDANLCNHLLNQILPTLALLDPACGSGAFLVAAMKTLISIYHRVAERAKELLENPHPLTPSPKTGEGEPEKNLTNLTPLSPPGRGARHREGLNLTPLSPPGRGARHREGLNFSQLAENYWEISPALRKKMLEISRQLRQKQTPSEKIVWELLRNRKLEGRKFRRQQPIGVFVVDFFCAAERLIVEIDGKIHESQKELDDRRQELLESLGLRFIRLSAELVEKDIATALEQIKNAFLSSSSRLGENPHPLTPSPKSGENPHPLTPSPKSGEGEPESSSSPKSGEGEPKGEENQSPSPHLGEGFRVREKLTAWLADVETHPSLEYYIKKRIITDNLYGVDIMEEATEIAKLRLFLALVAAAKTVEDLEPLPNIDFNIMPGNSLIGLIRVDGNAFDSLKAPLAKGGLGGLSGAEIEPTQINLLGETVIQGNLLNYLAASEYQQILEDKNQSIDLYKKHAFQKFDPELPQETRLLQLRDHIEKLNQESQAKLNQLLFDEFSQKLGIKYEAAQLKGKAKKRVLQIGDIDVLKPFHWGYHFDKVFQRGGFDAIITNPPWEVFKPNAKEFFAQYSDVVTKNKMDIKSFQKAQKKLLENPEVAAAWLEYQSKFPYVSAYYRSADDYRNQISVVNGRKAGTDINLYKLFLERCYHVLRDGGECGIVIPSGIYTDLGTKQLREMLFSQTTVTGLFCFENRQAIFEGVDSRFKFVVLSFGKGGQTDAFPARFMRHEVKELLDFPNSEDIIFDVDLIRRLSPDSLSVMEFKDEIDIKIAEKLTRFPLLGEKIEGKWNLKLKREFDMTNHSYLFKTEPAPGRLPLYEGKMIHQFTHQFAEPRYWVDEAEGRKAVVGKKGTDSGQTLDYQGYRLGFRDVARNTDIRTMISTILPPGVFCPHTMSLEKIYEVKLISDKIEINSSILSNPEKLFVCSLLNSFVVDASIRKSVTAHVSFFFVYNTPVPRLQEGDRWFGEIVERAAKLICTTPEFDDLWAEVFPHPLTPSPKRGEGEPEPEENLTPLSRFGRGDGAEVFPHPLTPSPNLGEGEPEPEENLTPLSQNGRGDGAEVFPHPLTPSPNLGEGEPEPEENLTPLSRFGRGDGGEGYITNEKDRAQLRAELDGIIAHLYGLTETEFEHILSTFPIVPEETKQAALKAYQTIQ